MNKLVLSFLVICVLLALNCGGTKEFDITMHLTNPNDKAVKFGGYYVLVETDDTVQVEGYTPEEYNFTVEEGDRIRGLVYKDTVDVIDTLNFRLLADDDEKFNLDVILPYPVEAIQFELTVE